jgi:hypothetical protein
VELTLGGVERWLGVLAVDEELDLGAHRREGPAFDHDVLVIVSGGKITTRTGGAAAAAGAAA